MAKKQTEIDHPDIKPKTIKRLDDRAEAYRTLVRERMDMQTREEDAKQELLDEIEKQIEAGHLKVPAQTDSELVPVYKFLSDDGEMVVRWGRKKQVKVGKASSSRDEAAA
jgi:hypothetical protein